MQGGKWPRRQRTGGSCIQEYEARVDGRCIPANPPVHCVDMPPQTTVRLVDVDIMMGSVQGPKGCDTRTPGADYGNLFPRRSLTTASLVLRHRFHDGILRRNEKASWETLALLLGRG